MISKLLPFAFLGNFLTAFSAGAILAACIARGSEGGNGLDVILTYIVGSAISLLLLGSRRARLIARLPMLSLASCLVFLVFAWLGRASPSLAGAALVNYALLALLFSLLFVPRSLRTELIGESSGGLPLAELAYSGGYLVAFLDPFTFSQAGLPRLSLLGAALTLVASGLDARLIRLRAGNNPARRSPSRESECLVAPLSAAWAGSAVMMVVSATLGTQLVLQSLAAHFRDTSPLVGFELGTTLAPLVVSLSGAAVAASSSWRGSQLFLWRAKRFPVPLSRLAWLVFALNGLSCVAVIVGSPARAIATITGAASFFYELLALGLLQALGRRSGAIARTLAITAVFSSVSYWGSNLLAGSFPPYAALLLLGLAGAGLVGVKDSLPLWLRHLRVDPESHSASLRAQRSNLVERTET